MAHIRINLMDDGEEGRDGTLALDIDIRSPNQFVDLMSTTFSSVLAARNVMPDQAKRLIIRLGERTALLYAEAMAERGISPEDGN